MVGLDSWLGDEGLGKLVISLELCSALNIMEKEEGELLTVDVTFLIIVGCGDEEIVMLDSRGCWVRLDELLPKETEVGEGTTTTKEDAVTLPFPVTVDGWLGSVVE